MLARIKAWLHMRKVVPKTYRCKICTPFCPHCFECLGDFHANIESHESEEWVDLAEILKEELED